MNRLNQSLRFPFRRSFRSVLLLTTISLGLASAMGGVNLAQAQDTTTFKLTLMHTNDTRAHYLPADDGSGGVARELTVVKQIRAAVPNTLLLDSGGRFTGTLFHKIYQGHDNAVVMKLLKYDAMGLSNTEFDNGDEVLAKFIDEIGIPVVASNVTVSAKSPTLSGKILPSAILKVADQQIGIIGLAPVETPRLSSPSKEVSFSGGYATIIQREVTRLTSQGVNKIILLSQLGLDLDKKLAAQTTGVDVIIGGNSRDLLSNIYLGAAAKYPLVIKSKSGEPVAIVQAGGGDMRYLGRLDLVFDANGVITSSGGDTILLNQYIAPDPDMDAAVKDLKVEVDNLLNSPVKTLTGDGAKAAAPIPYSSKDCREKECAIGNLVTDAMRAEAGTQVALMNGGGLRAGIATGSITEGQVLQVVPYGNLLATCRLDGASLKVALENSVSRLGQSSGTGVFAQVSGLRYTYDASQPVGSRIIKVEILGDDGATYSPLDPAATYTVATNDYMRHGGDGYTVLHDKATDAYDFGKPLDEVLSDYISANSPLVPLLEDRIVVASGSAPPNNATAAATAAPTKVASLPTPTTVPSTAVPPTSGEATITSGACATGSGTANVSLVIDEIHVIQAEKTGNSNGTAPGGAAQIEYGVGIVSNSSVDFGPNLTYTKRVDAQLLNDSRLSSFDKITRAVPCGVTAVVVIVIATNGSSGSDTLGTTYVKIPLVAGKIPTLTPQTVDKYAGTNADGNFDYRVTYTAAIA